MLSFFTCYCNCCWVFLIYVCILSVLRGVCSPRALELVYVCFHRSVPFLAICWLLVFFEYVHSYDIFPVLGYWLHILYAVNTLGTFVKALQTRVTQHSYLPPFIGDSEQRGPLRGMKSPDYSQNRSSTLWLSFLFLHHFCFSRLKFVFPFQILLFVLLRVT